MKWFQGLSLKAIIIAGVVDVIGSNVIGVIAFVAVLFSKRLGFQDLADQAFVMRLVLSPDVFVPGFLGGALFSILAGYLAARIAGSRELAHGALSPLLGLAVSLSSVQQVPRILESVPAWLLVGGFVAAPILGLAGGWLRLATKGARP